MQGRMNPDIKRLWIEALLSGKYKQGTVYLRNNADEFCCLGVLCDLKDSNNWKAMNSIYQYDNIPASLPETVAEWAGMNLDRLYALGTFEGTVDGHHDLASLNDSEHTFEQITEVIEKRF